MTRGFFQIGIINPKFDTNIGTLWRHAYNYGANGVFVIHPTASVTSMLQCSDTCKSYLHMPFVAYESYKDFKRHLPMSCKVLPIEYVEGKSLSINSYGWTSTPTIILLGGEASGIPKYVLNDISEVPRHIETPKEFSLNVATAGTIIMNERYRSLNT